MTFIEIFAIINFSPLFLCCCKGVEITEISDFNARGIEITNFRSPQLYGLPAEILRGKACGSKSKYRAIWLKRFEIRVCHLCTGRSGSNDSKYAFNICVQGDLPQTAQNAHFQLLIVSFSLISRLV